jgi:transglutaminase-like putative cysteine protease
MSTWASRPATPSRPVHRAIALGVLSAAGAAAWWPVLGAGLLWAVPMALVVLALTLGRLRVPTGVLFLLAWVPMALLLAGVPASALRPGGWDASAVLLFDGLDSLTVPGRDPVVGDPWPLAGALLVGGAGAWLAAVFARRRGRLTAIAAFGLAALPLVAALLLEQPGDAAWPGAAVLAAGVLWAARGRLRTAIPATATVALVAAVGGQALGPQDRWLPFVDAAGRPPAFTRLDTTQSYGPLADRRTGATMLEVTADRPALWRMQVLQRFDGRGWTMSVRPPDPLPEPAATSTTTQVRVKGLRNALVVAPGRITGVDGAGAVTPEWGEARRLQPAPRKNQTYEVTSDVVDVTPAQLEDVQIPKGEQYRPYTQFWPRRGARRSLRPAVEMADGMPRGWRTTPFGRTLRLARELSRGTSSQLEIVRRVQSHLVDSGKYRYTTDVAEYPMGNMPVVDFLTESREGYCQHFAGGAALLLRLAGVPTRVVTGFATGLPAGERTYEVRDRDAHAWIEVYFPGYGWVPFNPTPLDAEAAVDAQVDLLATAGAGGASGVGLPPAVLAPLLVLLAGAGGIVLLRRRRGGAPVGDLLVRLAPGPVAPSTTLAALRPRLAEIGPAVAELADREERARFAGDDAPPTAHPRLAVWRALVSDRGAVRGTALLLRGVRRQPRAAAR